MKEKTKKVLIVTLSVLLAISILLNGWLLHSKATIIVPENYYANLDGCEHEGQSCTCSNTGWSGQCSTKCRWTGWGEYRCDVLYCLCN